MGKNIIVRKKYLNHVTELHGKAAKQKEESAIRKTGTVRFGSEKNKIKKIYHLSEKQLDHYLESALKNHEEPGISMFRMLETRLDNVLYRLGLVTSRSMAENLIEAGQVLVNDAVLDVPVYHVQPRDEISLMPNTYEQLIESDGLSRKKPNDLPSWLERVGETGRVKHYPGKDDVRRDIDFKYVAEFFARK